MFGALRMTVIAFVANPDELARLVKSTMHDPELKVKVASVANGWEKVE